MKIEKLESLQKSLARNEKEYHAEELKANIDRIV
jgi:hypothetical protein